MEKTELTSRLIIGIAVKTSNQNQQSASDIAQLWQKFMGEAIPTKIPNKISDDIYCIYTEYEGDFTQPYTTLIGCEVSSLTDIPDGMKGITIEGGEYLKLTARGKLSDGIVVKEWEKVWQADLPRTYKADFEVYPARNDNFDNMEIDIFVGVK